MKSRSIIIAISIITLSLSSIAFAESSIQEEQDQHIRIAVYDFATAEVYAKYYQQQRIASPINLKSESVVTPEDISVLPEYDRLSIKRAEVNERIRKQRAAERIRLERYNNDLEVRSKVRDTMLGIDYGRVILQGTQILEGDLANYSDVFEIYTRKQGQEAFQQEANLQTSSDQNQTLANAFTAPQYFIEGRVSDPVIEDNEILTEGSSIRIRTTTMSIAITMMDAVSRKVLPLPASFDATETERVLGRNFKSKTAVYQSLLRKICADAAQNIYDIFMTEVTVKVKLPKGDYDLDADDTDLSVEGEPQQIESIDSGEFKVTLRKEKKYTLTAENDDFKAEKTISVKNPRTINLKLTPTYVTLNLKYKVKGDFDPDDATVLLRPQENGEDEEDLGYGTGPFDGLEPGKYIVVVEADGYDSFTKKVNWKNGGSERITVKLKPSAGASSEDNKL